ncbi:carbohydrate-binding module family 18 protein [Lentithecium fluviatile CBS 122367]|uniref:chitinase n=1 Tax=Lentithecium fluviatile CBS 122367 TaxID=1168545 RepID=A0A6G1JM13_9PLEO|nr:carbohydrate-binding module family 18 protein [Lentithecium fluviatile CBS 122367]
MLTPFISSFVVGLLASTALAGYSAASGSNVVVYWGQGNAQIPLSEVCSDSSVDIVNIAFVNVFPKKVGDYPGTNFANACGAEKYPSPSGGDSELLSNCPTIGPGIDICHANGKKVLLSIGGGWPIDYYLPSQELAEYFAEFLWGAFGPTTQEWKDAGKPRPFGDAFVDGFDLDIEAYMDPAPSADYLYANYDHFVSKLKNDLYPTVGGGFYISGAPQCQIPDARLAHAISNSHFDFVFVQFYNTAQCSVRAGYNGLNASSTGFTFDDWVAWLKANSANEGVKLYIGMPANTEGALAEPTAYLTPNEANELIPFYAEKHADMFGGVMLWEATISSRNSICNKGYATHIKDILFGTYVNASCPNPSPSPTSSAIATPTAVSPNGLCGPTNGYSCVGSGFGNCCSAYGFCGSTTAHCDVGCNPLFGICGSSSSSTLSSTTPTTSPTTSSAIATPTAVSPNGACGPSNGFNCAGSGFGDCCSEYGFCGTSATYCDTGCNPLFGKCSSGGNSTSSTISSTTPTTSSTTSSASATPTLISSPDGSCGGNTSYTCVGYHMGECCSQHGFCGGDAGYCDAGCNPLFGKCNPSGDNSTSSPIPSSTPLPSSSSSIILGTGSSSIVSSSVSVPFPTGNNSTSVPFPTGTSSTPITGTGSSSIPLGTGSSSSVLVSSSSPSVPYPTGVNFTTTPLSSSVYGSGSSVASPFPGSSSTPSPTLPTYPVTSDPVYPSSGYHPSGPSGVSPTSSSASHGYNTNNTGPRSTSTTPCPTSISTSNGGTWYGTSSIPGWATASQIATPSSSVLGYDVPSASYPTSTPAEGYGSYPASPSVISKPSHPGTYPSPATTTVFTTTYIDICPTGFTTVTATITKTVCPSCATTTKPSDVPEGWTTKVTICGHCGPKTTTVTLTKPISPPTNVPHYASYTHAVPEEEEAITNTSKIYTMVTATSVSSSLLPSYYPTDTPDGEGMVTNKVYLTSTATALSSTLVPSFSPISSVLPANSTAVYAPSGTATTSSPTYPYIEDFEGAASQKRIGLSIISVLIAGLLLL